MMEGQQIGNPEAPKIDKEKLVRADHPSLVSTIRQAAKQGMSKEQAMKITGAPREIIDTHYKSVQEGR